MLFVSVIVSCYYYEFFGLVGYGDGRVLLVGCKV